MAYLHRPDSESGARRVSYRGRCWEDIDEHGSCDTVRANSISENAHSRFRLTRKSASGHGNVTRDDLGRNPRMWACVCASHNWGWLNIISILYSPSIRRGDWRVCVNDVFLARPSREASRGQGSCSWYRNCRWGKPCRRVFRKFTRDRHQSERVDSNYRNQSGISDSLDS